MKRARAGLNNSSTRVRIASFLNRETVTNKVAKNGARTHRIQPNIFIHTCNLVGTLSTCNFLVGFGRRSSDSIFIVVASVSSLLVPFLVLLVESIIGQTFGQAVDMHMAQPHAVQHKQMQRNGTISASMVP